MRLVISGTRDGHPSVERWLEAFDAKHGRPGLTILGDANGVDAQAYAFCVANRWSHAVLFAYWDELGRTVAGPERNGRMIELASAEDWFLGFPGPGSKGTYDCRDKAVAKGLRVEMAPVKAAAGPPMRHPLRC